MKHESAVELYTTKFSYSISLLKIKESLMSIEKMYFNDSQKSLSQQLLVEISLCRFHFNNKKANQKLKHGGKELKQPKM